jgi:Flp pilus assembly protein TadG
MTSFATAVRRVLQRPRSILRRMALDVRGLAAIEFALIAGFLAIAALNVSDVAVYLFDEIQVNNATEMGAQAAWTTCDLNHLPATTKCTTMNSAITTAIQSTPLGSGVALQSGSPSEAFYCASSSGTLQYMADITNPPADCTAAGVSTELPGDYVEVQTSYAYRPMFPGLSVGSLFPSTISSSSWTRLGS